MVTHDPSEAISCADRISVMHQGNITQTGAPQDVYRNSVDRQTAEIFGAVNCLPIEQRDGRLLTPVGEWQSPVAQGATEVFCRPEQLRLIKPDDANSGSEFEVRSISREGPTLVYLLRNSEGLELTVRTLDVDGVDAGQVRVGLRPGTGNA